jgi:hypothetical protein
MGKGANFTTTEDLMICQSFVAASQDGTVGTDQKASDFMLKMFESYCKLVDAHNKKNNTRYDYRQGHSNYSRFKKLSKFVLKLIGIEESAGDPPTGDNDLAEWNEQCKETFLQRHPDGKPIFDNIMYVKDFLQECPKWRPFEEQASAISDRIKKKQRPEGNKKQKQMKQDMETIKKLAGLTKAGNDSKESQLANHQAAQRNFMEQVGGGMTAFASVLSEQNDIKLLDCMTPTTRNEMAKEMFRMKMKQRFDLTKMKARSVSLSTKCPPRDVIAVESSDSDAVNGNSDDSPGDNRKRSPGGTLRLPEEYARKYAAAREAANKKRKHAVGEKAVAGQKKKVGDASDSDQSSNESD